MEKKDEQKNTSKNTSNKKRKKIMSPLAPKQELRYFPAKNQANLCPKCLVKIAAFY